MIIGYINANREPIVTLSIRDRNDELHQFPATIDTGFTDFAALAPDVIALLQLEASDTRFFVLGDGKIVELPIYTAIVDWDGQDRECVIVEADDDPLIGMEMLDGFTLFMDAAIGGEVRIERKEHS